MKYNVALQRAIGLVMHAFGDQVRTGPVHVPAWTHSVRVGLSLLSYGYEQDTVVAGILHDTIEDTGMTAEMIESLFNRRVRFIVETCSYDPKLGDTPAGIADIHRRVFIAAERGDTAPLIVKIDDSNDCLKTNADLKPQFQIGQFQRGLELREAGRKYLPGQQLVDDHSITVLREMERLGL